MPVIEGLSMRRPIFRFLAVGWAIVAVLASTSGSTAAPPTQVNAFNQVTNNLSNQVDNHVLTIPAGKRLAIDYFSAKGTVPAGRLGVRYPHQQSGRAILRRDCPGDRHLRQERVCGHAKLPHYDWPLSRSDGCRGPDGTEDVRVRHRGRARGHPRRTAAESLRRRPNSVGFSHCSAVEAPQNRITPSCGITARSSKPTRLKCSLRPPRVRPNQGGHQISSAKRAKNQPRSSAVCRFCLIQSACVLKGSIRAPRSSTLPRPYIACLSALSLLVWPAFRCHCSRE